MYTLRQFLAGTGLLIFGLATFEQAIKSLGGRQLKHILENQTRTIGKGMLSGTRISLLTTSSTFVSLLLVAFVGGGLLTLQRAIPIVLGANIGTTINSLGIAYLGFGGFKIALLALPLIAGGGIIYMFRKKQRLLDIARIGIGVGLLFLGLEYMKISVEAYATTIELGQRSNLWIYGLLGFSVTALLHSQAAMSLITLSALSAGLIGIEDAFAIVIGANVGTTMTAVVASIGGSKPHKQIALAHCIQNLIAAGIGVLFFKQFIWLSNVWFANILGYTGNYVLATAWFNTLFNTLTALPFLRTIPLFTRFLEYITGFANHQHHFFIDKIRNIDPAETPISLQLQLLQKDIDYIPDLIQTYTLSLIHMQKTAEGIMKHAYTPEQQLEIYHQIKDTIDYLYSHLLKIQTYQLTPHEVTRSTLLEHTLTSYVDIAKSYKSIAGNIEEIYKDKHPSSQAFYDAIVTVIQSLGGDEITNNTIQQTLQHPYETVLQHSATGIIGIDIATLVSTEQQLQVAYEKWGSIHHNSPIYGEKDI